MKSPSQPGEKPVVIGLDIGGTKVAAGVVSFPEGAILEQLTIPTLPARGGRAVLNDIFELARGLADHYEGVNPVRGVGLGVCELVDPNGNVTSRQTLDWVGMPIQEQFGAIAPAVVESDVRAAALAEALYGAGRPFSIFAYVTIGTGISHTLVKDRSTFAGARGNALVMASGPFTSDCPFCGASADFVLEEFASGPALVARYNKLSKRQVTRGHEIFAAANDGDDLALKVLTTAGDALGNMMGLLVNILDPEAVVVGGGLGLAGGVYWQAFESSVRKHIWYEGARNLPILPAALGVEAGLTGAAAAAWQKLTDPKVK